jgi:SAM-dependent methyltransferase
VEATTARKRYDRAYFDRWYRGRSPAVGSRGALRRKVAAAVAITEFVLDRELRSVLDVGCGEGRWQPELFEMRPEAAYLGIDSSEYAVERFGAARNLRSGSFGELELHDFDAPFDLVVCSDVLHYLERREILRGLPALVERVEGVAFLEVFTRADEIEGDMVGFQRRPPAAYRRMFANAGLVPIGLQFYVPDWRVEDLDALEVPG